MNISCRHGNRAKVTFVALLLCAAGGLPTRLYAQSQDGPPKSDSVAGSDDQLALRVKAALRADPDISDKHIDVTIERGKVVLRGFVFDNTDRRHAVDIARDAAEGRKVVDNIELVQGGP